MSGPAPHPGSSGILRYERPQPVKRFRPRAWVWWLVAGSLGAAALAVGGRRVLLARRVVAVRVELVAGPGAQRAPAPVEVASARGVVVARSMRVVYPQRRGRLAALGVNAGASVRAGVVIARLENRALADSAELAESLLTDARSALVRAQALRDRIATRVASQRVAEALRRSRRAQVQLNETYVNSSMAGTVFQRLAGVGDSVAPEGDGRHGRGIVVLVDQTTQQVHADVPAGVAGLLFRDQDVRITLDTIPRRPHAGVVAAIEPRAGSAGTTRVKINFVQSDRRVFPGFPATVAFLARPPAAMTALIEVAEQALRPDRGQMVVWVVAQGRLQRRVVDPAPPPPPTPARSIGGGARAARRVIRAGLVGGETIVVDGPPDLRQGQRVRLIRPGGGAVDRDASPAR